MNWFSPVFTGLTSPKLTLGTYGPVPFIQLPLKIRLSQATSHWHIIGTSGSGKSYFLAQLFLSLLQHGLPVTLIDPHGDLAKLVLTHLVGQGKYKDPITYERIVYLDLPAGERKERYLPFNPPSRIPQTTPSPVTSRRLSIAPSRNSPRELPSLTHCFPVLCGCSLPITCP